MAPRSKGESMEDDFTKAGSLDGLPATQDPHWSPPSREVLKKWLEPKHRKQAGNDEDLASIVSSGDELPPVEDPNDPPYRQRPGQRSRVVDDGGTDSDHAKDRAPKARTDKTQKPSVPKVLSKNDDDKDGPLVSVSDAAPPVMESKVPKKRCSRFKSSAIITDSDRDPSPEPRRREPAPFPMTKSGLESTYTLDAFLDDQAVEVNSRDGSVYSGRGVGSQDEDAYDCGDSFIDDGDVTNDSDKHVSRKGRDHRHVRSSDLPSEYRHDGSDSDRQHQSRVTNARHVSPVHRRSGHPDLDDERHPGGRSSQRQPHMNERTRPRTHDRSRDRHGYVGYHDDLPQPTPRRHRSRSPSIPPGNFAPKKYSHKVPASRSGLTKDPAAGRRHSLSEEFSDDEVRYGDRHRSRSASPRRDGRSSQYSSRLGVPHDVRTPKSHGDRVPTTPRDRSPLRGSILEDAQRTPSRSSAASWGRAKDTSRWTNDTSPFKLSPPIFLEDQRTQRTDRKRTRNVPVDILEISSDSSVVTPILVSRSKGSRPGRTVEPPTTPSRPRPRPRPIPRPASSVTDISGQRDAPTRPTLTAAEKGKGKRVRSPSPVQLGAPSPNKRLVSQEGLHDRESDDIRIAIDRSLQDNTGTPSQPKQGETSAQGVRSSPVIPPGTPQSAAVPTGVSASSEVAPTTPGSIAELVAAYHKLISPAQGSPPSAPTPAVVASPQPSATAVTLVRRCTTLPEVCEVTNAALQDPILAAVYKALPKLRAGLLIGWADVDGQGHPDISIWAALIPSLPAGVILAAVNFVRVGNMCNIARISPLDVGLRIVGDSDREHFFCADDPPAPLIAVSCGLVQASALLSGPPKGMKQKWIKVIFHTQEWQRSVGFVCTVAGVSELHAQYAMSALQISTRPEFTKKPAGAYKGKGLPKHYFRKAENESNGNSVPAMDDMSLPFSATVPVYDGRALKTPDFSTILPGLPNSLPLYTSGEIPSNSFVMVGYTITTFIAATGNQTAGFNIKWVILLGTP